MTSLLTEIVYSNKLQDVFPKETDYFKMEETKFETTKKTASIEKRKKFIELDLCKSKCVDDTAR